jgi:tetratricopeptide (TPR) repeat protein
MGGLVSGHPKRVFYWEKAISLFREVGDFFMACGFTIFLADFEMAWGNFESARLRLNEALRLNQEKSLGQEKNFYFPFILGRINSINGDFKQARVYLQEAIKISEDQGHRMNILWLRTNLGYLALREDNINKAYNFFAETAPAFQKDNNSVGVAFTLEGLARYYVVVGKLNKAARLVGWADAARKKIGDTRPPVEQADVDKVIAACIAKMGEAAFSDAYEEGKKMELDEAVAYALET